MTDSGSVEVKQPPASNNGQQWMAMPQLNGGASGVPPGLEYLAQIDQLVIHQQIELFEALSGIECKNRYVIKNTLGQQVYYAYEESSFCHRCWCGAGRGFVMHIVDNQYQEVMRLVRPFKCCAGCCWCADAACCSYEINIESPPGQVIGSVRQIGSKWKPMYEILDDSRATVLRIGGPCCPCQTICCTADVDFKIKGSDGVTDVGKVSKQWGGFFREVITQADNFSCTFPMDMDVRMKATLLGASFLIDYMYFEKENNN
ncbi:phospholipid scramblase 1-like [Patiria miniata]|uniref:Phospholipid scramblase n=1 Tax=Patiria miniata TaxID=46514 RepID=A0A914ADY3_PATMI|nr:phospholipid scramblase 1-like [Patiria miniata]